jgi:XTP/dITP diphosphohydrolase
MNQIVVATRNPGKLREFRSLLATTGWRVLSLVDAAIDIEAEETGTTFAENARQKALVYSRETALPVLADDSGLEVFALGGRPGLHSARYAGDGADDSQRIGKLLSQLAQAAGGRDARFVCVLALAKRGRLIDEAEGECRGVIADAPRGTHGFGYDPVFLFPELGKTYAELSEEEKNRVSHRARAVASLLEHLAGGMELG